MKSLEKRAQVKLLRRRPALAQKHQDVVHHAPTMRNGEAPRKEPFHKNATGYNVINRREMELFVRTFVRFSDRTKARIAASL